MPVIKAKEVEVKPLNNPGDNVFELGALYKLLVDLRIIQKDKMRNHPDLARDVERIIQKVKLAIVAELDRI